MTAVDSTAVAVTCTRCHGARWPFPPPDPVTFVCIRCRAVLAGRNAEDPVVVRSPAQQAVSARLAASRTASSGTTGAISCRQHPPRTTGDGS